MAVEYQCSDSGPVMLITVAQPGGGYCGHRILIGGPQAGREMSCTKICETRAEAMDIMRRNPPILTRTNGDTAPTDLRIYNVCPHQ